MFRLLHEHLAAISWLAVFSVFVFVGSLLFVPWLVVRIPQDYFASDPRPRTIFADRHPVLRWTALIIKNLVGGLLVLAGIAMLVLPGQGVLTIMLGVMLLDFPGKHRLERRIIRLPPVRNSVNWLRRKANAPPLQLDAKPERQITESGDH